jgi:D-alanyl-lipoteichoic acid acyltransferase DltB (MBOAT superfamily)
MLFNSINFAIFLPIVFLLYWWASRWKVKVQNTILLVASYYFYACWDWRFQLLLLFSTLLDYYAGIKIDEEPDKKKKTYWLYLSVVVNVGLLAVLKYYNFFVASFSDGLGLLGLDIELSSLQLIIPLGISFYTFHGLSYIIDIYNDRIKPERDVVNYALFVCFFPLLVAGPIERATHLLPQIIKKREFNYTAATDGLRQILWGLFKKIVIADNCAKFANLIFENHTHYSGSTLVVGALFFTFQIYADFSGYSDIAIGTARLFGINIMKNFAFPYFSKNIAEFWRRWHISLSSWFKDYVYIPLGGSRMGRWKRIRNTGIVFLVCGLWHGANWTFVVWGLLNALYMLPSILFGSNQSNNEKNSPTTSIKELLGIATTFGLTVIAWIVFRSTSVTEAIAYLSEMFSTTLFSIPDFPELKKAKHVAILTGIFMMVEWQGKKQEYAIEKLGSDWNKPLRWAMYYAITLLILNEAGPEQQFIYFQF